MRYEPASGQEKKRTKRKRNEQNGKEQICTFAQYERASVAEDEKRYSTKKQNVEKS